MSKQLNTAHSELEQVNKEMDAMNLRLEESDSSSQKMQRSLDLMSRKKEELAEQLTNSLLELVNTSLATKQKLKISAVRIAVLSNVIGPKSKLHDSESNFHISNVKKLTDSLLELELELELEKKSCSDLDKALLQSKETIAVSENNTMIEMKEKMKISDDKIAILSNQLTGSLLELELEKKKCSDLEKALLEAKEAMEISEKNTLLDLKEKMKISDDKIALLSNDALKQNKEKTKLRMKLIGEHKRSGNFVQCYKDLGFEMISMEEKFKSVVAEQKKQLGKYAGEILRLKESSMDERVNTNLEY